MKILNIALRALLATIGTAPCAHARIPSPLRDPRTVEEKDVRRQTMGTHFLSKNVDGSTCENLIATKEKEYESYASFPDEAKSLACSAVSQDFPECLGCQGYERKGKEVHIPGCVGMEFDQCVEMAEEIVQEQSEWFKDGANTKLNPEELSVDVLTDTYYKVGLPVLADNFDPDDSEYRFIKGLAGDCMVHYPWDWCVSDTSGHVKCIKIGPFDCEDPVNGGCLNSDQCCKMIQDDKYPAPDINGNKLQCYEWEIPSKSINGGNGESNGDVTGGGDSGEVNQGSLVGNRLIIHLSNEKVALPAVITDGLGDEENKEGTAAFGTIRFSESLPNMCFDASEDQTVSVYPPFLVGTRYVSLKDCNGSADQDFFYDELTMQIKLHRSPNLCLSQSKYLMDCNELLGIQKWYLNPHHEMKSADTQVQDHCLAPDFDSYVANRGQCTNGSKYSTQKVQVSFPMTTMNLVTVKSGTIRPVMAGQTKCFAAPNDGSSNVLITDCKLPFYQDYIDQDFYYDSMTMQIKLGHSGQCLDYDGSAATMQDCFVGRGNQKWHTTSNGELKSELNVCLGVEFAGTCTKDGGCSHEGAKIIPQTCNSKENQQYVFSFPIEKVGTGSGAAGIW